MKFPERYVRPFAEYCVRTPLSEEELVRALLAELPSEDAVFSGKLWKAFFGFCETFIIRERKDPLVLFPMLRGRRNLWRTWVHIRCEKTESSPGTLLHPTPEGFKLTHLFFFNVGAHGIPADEADRMAIERKFQARYEKLKDFPAEVGLPFVPANSNVHQFHPWGHLEVATLATASAALFLQRGIRRYYLASAGHPYFHLWHYLGMRRRPDDIAYLNSYLLPWLSTESLDFVDDGTFLDRSQKTVLIADYEPATRYLNVCCNHDALDTNCSICPKCCRTLLTLELIGKVDAFRAVFDVDKYRREARRLFIAETLVNVDKEMFFRHIVDLAEERGVNLRREVNCLDMFRARMMNGRLHTFIRNSPLLKRLAKKFFK